MDTSTRVLTLVLASEPASDPAELDGVTAQLRRRLLELDVNDVQPLTSSAIPPGAKPLDAISLGALVVTVSAAGLRTVVRLVEVWMRNRPVRSAKLTIGNDSLELVNASVADQGRLVENFLERHAGT